MDKTTVLYQQPKENSLTQIMQNGKTATKLVITWRIGEELLSYLI